MYLNLNMQHDATSIIFTANTSIDNSIDHNKQSNCPDNVELLHINNMNITCNIEDSHKIKFRCTITFDVNFEIPTYVEKMVVMILNKILIRTKQFIENYNNTI